ncbi:MAG: NYN domain-containing protein, partial [Dehalococcoidia bacterium]|nr:NYN domain-containing protein [Dehalococcoidia bacterium]
SGSRSKNSADIAIATQAMADLVRGRIGHVVVFSDDSDFISLYATIRDESGITSADGKVPFSWVVTDRGNTLSAKVKQFVPPGMLHVVSAPRDSRTTPTESVKPKSPKATSKPSKSSLDSLNEIVQAILADVPVGQFRSPDCQKILKNRLPQHPLSLATGAVFGTEFKNKIWPLLKEYDVKMVKQSPPRYEMAQQAKQILGVA